MPHRCVYLALREERVVREYHLIQRARVCNDSCYITRNISQICQPAGCVTVADDFIAVRVHHRIVYAARGNTGGYNLIQPANLDECVW